MKRRRDLIWGDDNGGRYRAAAAAPRLEGDGMGSEERIGTCLPNLFMKLASRVFCSLKFH